MSASALGRRDSPTLTDSMAAFSTDIARSHTRDLVVRNFF